MSDPLSPFPWFDVLIIVGLIAAQRRVRDERAGDRLVARGAAARPRQGRKRGRQMRAGAGRRPEPLPVDRADRDHPDRRARRRLFGRQPGRPGRRSGWNCSASSRKPRETVGFGIVIVLVTFLSLIIGELVPKQFALRSPEPIAIIVARPMRWLSVATAPFVWLLDQASALIFRLLGLEPRIEEPRHRRGTAPGRRRGADRRRARGKRARDHLGHRPPRRPAGARSHDAADRGRLDRHRRDAAEEIRAALLDTPHSRIPVADGSIENIVGVIQARDVMAALLEGRGDRPQAAVPRGAGHSRPDGRDGRAGGAAQRRRAAGAGPRRIWPSRRDRHPGQHPRRAWPAPSRTTSTRARSRRWSSATTAAGWCRARRAPTCSSTGSACNLPDDRDFTTVAGFALVGAQASAGDRRELPPRRLDVRDRRHGRAQDRQADRRRRRARRAAESRSAPRPNKPRACRTSARSRRCRCARDNRPARRSGRA